MVVVPAEDFAGAEAFLAPPPVAVSSSSSSGFPTAPPATGAGEAGQYLTRRVRSTPGLSDSSSM